MSTQFKDLINKAYAAFNERDIDKALSVMQPTCNRMFNGRRPGKVATSVDTMK